MRDHKNILVDVEGRKKLRINESEISEPTTNNEKPKQNFRYSDTLNYMAPQCELRFESTSGY